MGSRDFLDGIGAKGTAGCSSDLGARQRGSGERVREWLVSVATPGMWGGRHSLLRESCADGDKGVWGAERKGIPQEAAGCSGKGAPGVFLLSSHLLPPLIGTLRLLV